MTPKFSKADAYRTDKPIVSLCNSYEGQYIVNFSVTRRSLKNLMK